MFAKKIVSAFIALSFIFVAEAFARKSSEEKDDTQKTKISRKLRSNKKSTEKKKLPLRAQSKKNLELRKQKQVQLRKAQQKKNLELKKKQQAQFKKAQQKKKQAQPKKTQTSSKSSKSASRVFKEPTPYYVKVRDLPKDQQKQAAKYMGLNSLPKEGTIKFAHSDLDPQKTPTFKEFLDIKEKNRKAKKKSSSGFELFEYKDRNGSTFYSSSSEYSSEKSSKKDSNWLWPWNSSKKSSKKDSNWSWPWN